MSTSGPLKPSPSSTNISSPKMSSGSLSTRRSRPTQLQTNITSQPQPMAVTLSAASHSSAPANSHHQSPFMSPEPSTMLGGSSVHPSPESLRGRELEPALLPPLELPDAVISRRRSSNSMNQGAVTSPGSTAQEPFRAPNMMRRFSNKVSAFTGSMGSALGSSARRQSSVHPISRDGSVGPSVIRNRLRSNSNNSAIAPPDSTFYSDSEDEGPNDNDNLSSPYGGDIHDLTPLTTAGSPSGTSSPAPEDRGPTIPQSLENGTWITKLSRKGKPKKIFLMLDPDAAKIYWDKNSRDKWIYLDDIKEVRTGGDLSQYRAAFNAPDSYETRGFSLIVASPDKGKNRMIHLVADDARSVHDWTTAILSLMKHREEFTASLMAFDDAAVQAYWESEMSRKLGGSPNKDTDRRIDLSAMSRICGNLHIHLPAHIMMEKFDEAQKLNQDPRGDGTLDRRGFMGFVQLVKMRRDIRPIYQQYASDPRLGLTLEDFFRFLRESQAENVDEDTTHWKSVFVALLRKAKSKTVGGLLTDQSRLSEAAFASFFSTDANPLPKETEEIQPVLDRPMNEYYISSSHNTYLLGRQVGGDATVEGYISALSRGCRCVEIDCWDGPPKNKNEPVVKHGHSFTTEIPFREVIATIHKYAFVKTQYPLWLSLEVRCGPVAQENMARIMIDTFGEKLVLQPFDPNSDRLPSPSQLMGRILIKVKKPQGGDEFRKGSDIIGRKRGNSFTSPLQRPASMDTGSLPGSPLLSPLGNPSRKTSTRIKTINEGQIPEATSNSTSEHESDSDKDSSKKTTDKINPVLGCLGVYGAGITFNGFDTPEAREFNHIFSFKEKTFGKNSTPGEKKRALFRHNMRYMMRVYPDATRLSSSNFSPLLYWKRGVQMAALNWQTFDLGMQINQAMFECGADQTGYVLKSKRLREIQVMPNAADWTTKRERTNVRLSIDVISAQQLLRPINLEGRRTLDPYVEVELFVTDDKQLKGDSAGGQRENALKLRTKIVRGNGFNPEFGDRLEFPDVQTKHLDLVFVRWTVKLADKNVSDRSQILGTFTAKLQHLKQGYRTLPLLDHNGDRYLFSTLFCRINIALTNVFVPAPSEESEAGNGSSRFRVVRPSFLNRSNPNPKPSLDNGLS